MHPPGHFGGLRGDMGRALTTSPAVNYYECVLECATKYSTSVQDKQLSRRPTRLEGIRGELLSRHQEIASSAIDQDVKASKFGDTLLDPILAIIGLPDVPLRDTSAMAQDGRGGQVDTNGMAVQTCPCVQESRLTQDWRHRSHSLTIRPHRRGSQQLLSLADVIRYFGAWRS